ncbi:hypothetical protein SAMN05192585_10851 [Acetanaerobacterium elongatum]|uniref:Uncharacterized protein n=1 Tax=Acetanaerobacterium elongatum TaxID=258515 RepID=A0A1G9XER8_9FIRM|nr:hypothetical protein SAMN05192585_10851 [Acetanaerobacterium elongatum]
MFGCPHIFATLRRNVGSGVLDAPRFIIQIHVENVGALTKRPQSHWMPYVSGGRLLRRFLRAKFAYCPYNSPTNGHLYNPPTKAERKLLV